VRKLACLKKETGMDKAVEGVDYEIESVKIHGIIVIPQTASFRQDIAKKHVDYVEIEVSPALGCANITGVKAFRIRINNQDVKSLHQLRQFEGNANFSFYRTLLPLVNDKCLIGVPTGILLIQFSIDYTI